jgi:hypothetical protein
MAVTWIPEAEALADFPSERSPRPRARGARAARRSGVTMRVEPISWAVAWGVAVIVLVGLGSAAAIGILANRDTLLRAPAAPVIVSRQ